MASDTLVFNEILPTPAGSDMGNRTGEYPGKSSAGNPFADRCNDLSGGGFRPGEHPEPELVRMDILDSRINCGYPMGADVEKEYRAIIDSHEQSPQTEADRKLALEGRTRMLEHYLAAGDSIKVLQTAIETAQLYPEAFSQSRFLKVAADSFLSMNPTFKEMLQNAPPEQIEMYKRMVAATPWELEWSQKASEMMRGFADKVRNPDTHEEGLNEYRRFIAQSEHVNPQDRGDRRMAGRARLELLAHLQRDGADSNEIRQLAVDTFRKYPEYVSHEWMTEVAQLNNFANDAAFVKAYIQAGGDPAALKA